MLPGMDTSPHGAALVDMLQFLKLQMAAALVCC